MRLSPRWGKLAIRSEIESAMRKVNPSEVEWGKNVRPVKFGVKERACKKNEIFIWWLTTSIQQYASSLSAFSRLFFQSIILYCMWEDVVAQISNVVSFHCSALEVDSRVRMNYLRYHWRTRSLKCLLRAQYLIVRCRSCCGRNNTPLL